MIIFKVLFHLFTYRCINFQFNSSYSVCKFPLFVCDYIHVLLLWRYLKVFEPTEYLNQLAMNTLKNILKMINKINLAELLVCSEKKIQWQKMQNIKRQVSFIKWMSTYRLQQSHWNKYEKGNTFIKSFLFNMLLMKYSFIFLKTYYILLHSS